MSGSAPIIKTDACWANCKTLAVLTFQM